MRATLDNWPSNYAHHQTYTSVVRSCLGPVDAASGDTRPALRFVTPNRNVLTRDNVVTMDITQPPVGERRTIVHSLVTGLTCCTQLIGSPVRLPLAQHLAGPDVIGRRNTSQTGSLPRACSSTLSYFPARPCWKRPGDCLK
jgi:hypothetical protein